MTKSLFQDFTAQNIWNVRNSVLWTTLFLALHQALIFVSSIEGAFLRDCFPLYLVINRWQTMRVPLNENIFKSLFPPLVNFFGENNIICTCTCSNIVSFSWPSGKIILHFGNVGLLLPFPLEIPLTIHGGSMDIFWNHTFNRSGKSFNGWNKYIRSWDKFNDRCL